MEILSLEKLKKSIEAQLNEINGLIEMKEELLNELESDSDYTQTTRTISKLRGRARGLRQALSIAAELAVKLD